jgi:glucokinase
MHRDQPWTIGIDIGGTKIELAGVDLLGNVIRRVRIETRTGELPGTVEADMIQAIHQVREGLDYPPIGVGIGMAGQIEPETGVVRFAPNLNWLEVPLQSDMSEALGLPVFVTNDVRAATLGEWLFGAGHGCDDLLCLFVGTGIGGGIVTGGRLVTGCSNTAGELGHIIIDMNGPHCHCGSRGCMEALAGGWAIARRTREAVEADPVAGACLLRQVGGKAEKLTPRELVAAVEEGDPLALQLLDEIAEALVAGATGLVNAFNPCRLILGGGVMEGFPQLIGRIADGIGKRALSAASAPLEVLPSGLGNLAGVIGAAVLAMRELAGKEMHP